MNEESHSNDISLRARINVLWRYKVLLLCLPLVGAVVAALWVSFVLRPAWEASAVLEVGRVAPEGQLQLGQQATSIPPVELIPNVMTRMMLPSFAKGAIYCADFKPDESQALQGLYGTLKVNQVKNADLIEIKLRGPSAEIAKKLIQGAIANLQKVHSEMMAPSIARNQKRLQITIEDIHKTSAELESLRQKLLGAHNWNDFDATLAATILKDKSSDLRGMIQAKLMLEEMLSPSRTYTTRLVDEVYVSEGPVSPNKTQIIEWAFLLGLFAAIVIAFGHNAIFTKPIA